MMTTQEFLRIMDSGKEILGGSDVHEKMHLLSQEALRVTMAINSAYRTPEEITELLRELTGRDVPSSVRLFPPIYCDCGKNLQLEENVFINAACEFQDQGGIVIGEGTLIGPQVVIATLNHSMMPEQRQNMLPKPVHIGRSVWIGGHATILPGVEIGDDAVIGAGAVVTHNVPPRTVVAGVPAKVLRTI